MTYEKTADLLDLAILMQSNREGVSLEEIEIRYNVSLRTAQRMKDLILSRFPQTCEITEDGRKKRWFIPQGTLRDIINFNADELACLEFAKKSLMKDHLDTKVTLLDDIISKIKASIKPDTYRKIEPDADILLEAEGFALRPGPKLVIDKKIINPLREALLSCHQVKVQYLSKSTEKIKHYMLMPYGFLYGEKNHYLLAVHSDGYFGNKVHNFILNNIESVEILKETYQIDEEFSLQKYSEGSFGVYQEEPFEVEWLFDAKVAKEAQNYIFHPKQTIIHNQDGSLTVKFKAGGKVEMDWHLYTWGDMVKVIKPCL